MKIEVKVYDTHEFCNRLITGIWPDVNEMLTELPQAGFVILHYIILT